MAFTIKCPACNTDSVMSLRDHRFQGPYRCWKCRALFTIIVDSNELKSCQPLSQDEFDRMNKSRRSY
ncbi:MAG: hypothetical protein HY668_00550 [Chloroflexi bacterium]|nr:hypothetical protein [Chloroflexota bacterium]